jgi:3-isopropylmalate/(R)-2-methylmalate dehydratase small subunit
MSAQGIDRIAGTAVPLRGHDIDTDRIIPARFLRSVRFEGLEDHVFEDDRRALEGAATPHPFSNPAYRGAAILLVNRNFGSGSSREHAPQGLQRRGIAAIVGESFSEIFFGNAAALGLPCLTARPEAVETLMALVERRPDVRLEISVRSLTVAADGRTFAAAMPRATQEALVSGQWDATGLLLDRYEEVQAVAERLPYVTGFEQASRPTSG